MKGLILCLTVLVISTALSAQKADTAKHPTFTLSYISVGLGSNMWHMQPAFRAKDNRFIYTMEQTWQSENFKKQKPDTLVTGSLRQSSIDSIVNLANEIKGDSVYKLNSKVMSGGVVYLTITNENRTLHFHLSNSFDATAQKIIAILSTYIPTTHQQLWISNQLPDVSIIQ